MLQYQGTKPDCVVGRCDCGRLIDVPLKNTEENTHGYRLRPMLVCSCGARHVTMRLPDELLAERGLGEEEKRQREEARQLEAAHAGGGPGSADKPGDPLWMWKLTSGGIAALSVLLMYSGNRTLLSRAMFVIMTVVVTLGLLQLLAKLSKPVTLLLLPVLLICFFFIAFLMRAMPYLGYYGQTMDALSDTLFLMLLGAVPLVLLGPRIRCGRLGYRQLLVIAQVVALVAQLSVLGVSRWLPGWQARGLDVQVVRLDDAVLSPPLVEGQTAWLAQYSYRGDHALNQIDLSSGEVLQRIPLPAFTPLELDHPEWQDYGFGLRLWQSVISRIDEHTLELQYPTDFYAAPGEPVGEPLSIRMRVDLSQTQVVQWEPRLGEAAQAGFVPGPDYLGDLEQLELQVGDYLVSWQQAGLSWQSPTKHYLLRCNRPYYLRSLDDHTLLMGTGAELYVIKIK